MPARQPFDERHLQDVVLAQSEEIRPPSRFSGLRALTRPVVALAAIVAIVVVALGIKDYVGQQNANSPAGAATPTVEHTKAITRPKKTTTSGKVERTRMSATEATAAETSQAVADEMEKPLVGEESSDAGAKLMENRPNTLTAQAAQDEAEPAIDRDSGVPNARDTIAKPGSSACLPLPNGTQPQDVDGPYYLGWAKEYCGRDLSRPPAPPKVPGSQPSKK
jgi:hypothetical protein